MKKKSGHRRRTKVVRRSRKNLRRTVKRKRLGKGRRRPTRRYSRVQRGGLTDEELQKLINKANEGTGQLRTRAKAQFDLGERYYNGDGVEQNYIEAFNWYKRAADWQLKQFPEAPYNVGFMYANGQGVAQDDAEAFKWYKHAADMDDADSMYEVAFMYYNGQGVAQNHAEAVRWLRLAAAKGHEDAIYNLTPEAQLKYKNDLHLRKLDELQKLDESQKQFHGDDYVKVINEHIMPIPKPPQTS